MVEVGVDSQVVAAVEEASEALAVEALVEVVLVAVGSEVKGAGRRGNPICFLDIMECLSSMLHALSSDPFIPHLSLKYIFSIYQLPEPYHWEVLIQIVYLPL